MRGLTMQNVLGGSAGAAGIGGTLSFKGQAIVAFMFLRLGAGNDSTLLDVGAGHFT